MQLGCEQAKNYNKKKHAGKGKRKKKVQKICDEKIQQKIFLKNKKRAK